MSSCSQTVRLLEKLTGQPCLFNPCEQTQVLSLEIPVPFEKGCLGYSQFNELLITLGYDRVEQDFFDYLFDIKEETRREIVGWEELEQGINKFCQEALLLYGNIKYAFKKLSCLNKLAIQEELKPIQPISESKYSQRHAPLHVIKPIPPDKTYYLGYLTGKELIEKSLENPDDPELSSEEKQMNKWRKQGWQNHQSYLVSDHMDVYIATSMRQRFEFTQVGKFVQELFKHECLQPLNLRYFDPTQAYCRDRIDKGLVEGLMLKRARCTIYHVQENDSLGKDSELAATLAQGKPVIAYVPTLPDFETFKQNTLDEIKLNGIKQNYLKSEIKENLRERLKLSFLKEAWKTQGIKNWIEEKNDLEIDTILYWFYKKLVAKYDERAKVLKEQHPLAIQVNLSTGVANGVLVVRTVSDCAELLRRIILGEMKFKVEHKPSENGKERISYTHLVEEISECTYRVATGDRFLVDAFWNFYLKT